MKHLLSSNGDGKYCSRCDCSWDMGEPIPETCIPVQGELATAPAVIAFTGRAGCGKDTAAAVFKAAGYTQLRMADGLKAMLHALLAYRGCPPEQAHEYIDGAWKERPCHYFGGKTARHAMQTLGTEWGRTHLGPDIWAEAVNDNIRTVLAAGGKVVISDIRFHNEVRAIEAVDGEVWRIERNSARVDTAHVSEQAFRELAVKGTIQNSAPSATAFQHIIADTFNLNL